MAYKNEKASKFAYHTIINDPKVKKYLSHCFLPDEEIIDALDIEELSTPLENIKDTYNTEIKKLIAIDGGYQIIEVDAKYPSAKIAYYSAGVLSFNLELFDEINKQQTIDPDDIVKIKELHKQNFQLPLQNIRLKNESFVDSIRITIFNIFKTRSLFENDKSELDNETILLDTVKWLVFEEYKTDDSKGKGKFSIKCPNSDCNNIINFKKINDNYQDKNDKLLCKDCHDRGEKTVIYLTDVFEMHEIVDEHNGANPIVSTLLNVFEVILLITVFRFTIENKNIEAMSEYSFLKDGPLAIFSKNNKFAGDKIFKFISFMHQQSLIKEKNLMNIIGLDKSGYFMEHLKNVENKLLNKHVFLPNLSYIQKYIIGDNKTFGQGSYFGIKMIYKHDKDLSFVFDIPVPVIIKNNIKNSTSIAYKKFLEKPQIKDFINLKAVLEILISLKCDIYDKSFIPIALINKHVSVSQNPGKKMLTLFTKEELIKRKDK